MSRFHHDRVPLIILISGTFATGKSSIATQLSEYRPSPLVFANRRRLNLTSVLCTDLLFVSGIIPNHLPLWSHFNTYASVQEFIKDFKTESDLVSSTIANNLKRMIADGKSVIVEGVHVTPALVHTLLEIAPDSVILPFLLTIDTDMHLDIINNWVDRQLPSHLSNCDDVSELLVVPFQIIQDVLVGNADDHFIVQDVDANIVNSMHQTVLDTITQRFHPIERA